MKRGYRILLHKDIPEELLEEAQESCDNFIALANSPDGYKCRHDSYAFYRRGIFGLIVNHKNRILTFKRLSGKRRIFGVIPVNQLEAKDGGEIDSDQKCICGVHLGGTRVNIKGGFQERDYHFYYETGEIKG
jgi:hypothetical protein